MLESYEVGKKVVKIYQDECIDSPRDWDNLGAMICFHSRYDLGDKHDYKTANYNGWDDMEEAIAKEEDAAVILPLYLYDHSGLAMSTTRDYPFNCPWDSMQVGFIFVTRLKVRNEWKGKRLTKKVLQKVRNCLEHEVETYNQYLRGEVYSYTIEDKEGEVVNSCGGFFEFDYCKECALEAVNGG